jgi:hypothetical protein
LPSTRLPELLLLEILRLHLSTAPAADHGWLAALTRCSPPLCRDCTLTRRGDGASLNWPRLLLLCRAQRSTIASGDCSASRPSAPSPIGGCTSPRRCSLRPSRLSLRSHDASGTSRRRRSAARSSGSMATRLASGETPFSASDPPARRIFFSICVVLPNWNAQDNTGRHEPPALGPLTWTGRHETAPDGRRTHNPLVPVQVGVGSPLAEANVDRRSLVASCSRIGNQLATRDSGRDRSSHEQPGPVRKRAARMTRQMGAVRRTSEESGRWSRRFPYSLRRAYGRQFPAPPSATSRCAA